MNNNANLIKNFFDYLKNEKITNPKISLIRENIVINTIPLNFNLATDYFLLAISIVMIKNNWEDSDYKLLYFIVFLLSIICIWKDLRYVNFTIVDYKNRTIVTKSKNIIERWVFGKIIISFDELHSFYVNKTNSFSKGVIRFAILMKLKNQSSIIITDISEEKDAHKIADFLNQIIS